MKCVDPVQKHFIYKLTQIALEKGDREIYRSTVLYVVALRVVNWCHIAILDLIDSFQGYWLPLKQHSLARSNPILAILDTSVLFPAWSHVPYHSA